MGRKSRRKRDAWRCRKCGMRMYRGLAEEAERIKPDRRIRFVQLCGGCKAMHFEENGVLRLLTEEERRAVDVQMPRTMEEIASAEMPTFRHDTVTMILGDG